MESWTVYSSSLVSMMRLVCQGITARHREKETYFGQLYALNLIEKSGRKKRWKDIRALAVNSTRYKAGEKNEKVELLYVYFLL